MIIKDAMVLIHLAKMTVLEKSCDYFKKVEIAKTVYAEILFGKKKGFADAALIENIVKNGKIIVKEVKNTKLISKANEFNIKGSEAESIALYWRENADYLASDDDNVRKKADILNMNVIGTPAILSNLYEKRIIEKNKFIDSVNKLKKIGWFNNSVIDKLLMKAK